MGCLLPPCGRAGCCAGSWRMCLRHTWITAGLYRCHPSTLQRNSESLHRLCDGHTAAGLECPLHVPRNALQRCSSNHTHHTLVPAPKRAAIAALLSAPTNARSVTSVTPGLDSQCAPLTTIGDAGALAVLDLRRSLASNEVYLDRLLQVDVGQRCHMGDHHVRLAPIGAKMYEKYSESVPTGQCLQRSCRAYTNV